MFPAHFGNHFELKLRFRNNPGSSLGFPILTKIRSCASSKRHFFSFLEQYCSIFWSSYLGSRTLSRILLLWSLSITSSMKSVKWVSICICFSQRLRKWALFCDLEQLIWIFWSFHVKMVLTERLRDIILPKFWKIITPPEKDQIPWSDKVRKWFKSWFVI